MAEAKMTEAKMTEAKTDQEDIVVLITGTSSGIGKALTLRLITYAHFTVFATMRTPDSEKGKSLLDDSKNAKGKLHILPHDVTDTDACAKVVETVVKTCGRIDVLVNNAGYMLFGASECNKLDNIKDLFNTNVFGLIDMCQRVLPLMRERRQGRVINISSVGGVLGQAFCDSYCSTKFAVEGYTQSIARYYRSFGVHCCTICPGGVKTSFGHNMKMPNMQETPKDIAPLYQKAFEFYRKKNALESQDVGEVVSVIECAINDKQPKIRYTTNPKIEYIFELTCGKNVDGEASQDFSDEKMFDNWK